MFRDSARKIKPKDLKTTLVELPEKDNYKEVFTTLTNPVLRTLVNIAYDEEIEEVILCGYRFSQNQAKHIEELQKINRIPFPIKAILSSSITRIVKPSYFYLKDNPGFEITWVDTHAKWLVVITKENHYFIMSSANTNSDNKLESLTIFNNFDICEYYITFAKEVKGLMDGRR